MNSVTESILVTALCKCGHPLFSHIDTASRPCAKCYCEKFELAHPQTENMNALNDSTIRNIRYAIESGIEYARMCLREHDSCYGRTTLKNKNTADSMESDIEAMLSALTELPKIGGV